MRMSDWSSDVCSSDLGDGVIIGSGAQVLGPITVGPRARIGANAVVTRDVPEGATMVGIPAKPVLVDAADYAKDFVPYGTPCNEMFDPGAQKLDILRCAVERLNKRVAELIEERDGGKAPNRKRGWRARGDRDGERD